MSAVHAAQVTVQGVAAREASVGVAGAQEVSAVAVHALGLFARAAPAVGETAECSTRETLGLGRCAFPSNWRA